MSCTSAAATLLIATTNPGKLKEMAAFLGTLPFHIVGLEELGEIPICSEDGDSFDANARQKALTYSRLSNWLTVADDSGLEVDALGGQPGIHSARYVSPTATDEERYREVMRRMEGVPEKQRSARFVCAMALARQGSFLAQFRGVLEGTITREPRGSQGFGYDPIFWVPELKRTVAELSIEEKERVSHRGIALRALRDYFQGLLLKLELSKGGEKDQAERT